MFSEEDVMEVYRLVPPVKQLHSEKSGLLPPLVKTANGHGFITEHSLHHAFEHIVIGETNRVAFSTVSNQLDIDSATLLQLVRASPDVALLSQDGRSIVPQQERNAIITDLEDMLAKRLILKPEFTHAHDIHRESVDTLAEIPRVKEHLRKETDDYLLGEVYIKTLSDTVSQKLADGLEHVRTVELSPQSLPGAPPIWLTRQLLHSLPGGFDIMSQFYSEGKDGNIICTPKQSILCKRDELIIRFQSGEIFCYDRRSFYQDFQEIYTSADELDKELSGMLSIVFVGDFAVSTKRLSDAASEGMSMVEEQGFVDLTDVLPPDAPQHIQDDVRDRIAQIIITACSGRDIDVRKISHFILTTAKFELERSRLLNIARSHATKQWDEVKETPDKDLKFQIVDIFPAIAADEHLLRSIAQGKQSETATADTFWSEISELESKNEAAFSTFWHERVSLRVHNYSEGLKHVEDSKLHGQLAELLSGYLQKEFLPDMVSKARSQGLVCSRKSRKNVQRFEVTLKSSKSDLTSVLSTLEKFGKKQGLLELDPTSSEEAKKTLIQDMVRKMQKPKTDAPLMFLSLVLVLFAKYHPGVLYATGKFAPKLLKLLKSNLDSGDYDRVEKWKELAKAGTLADEDREVMAQMADQTIL